MRIRPVALRFICHFCSPQNVERQSCERRFQNCAQENNVQTTNPLTKSVAAKKNKYLTQNFLSEKDANSYNIALKLNNQNLVNSMEF